VCNFVEYVFVCHIVKDKELCRVLDFVVEVLVGGLVFQKPCLRADGMGWYTHSFFQSYLILFYGFP